MSRDLNPPRSHGLTNRDRQNCVGLVLDARRARPHTRTDRSERSSSAGGRAARRASEGRTVLQTAMAEALPVVAAPDASSLAYRRMIVLLSTLGGATSRSSPRRQNLGGQSHARCCDEGLSRWVASRLCHGPYSVMLPGVVLLSP